MLQNFESRDGDYTEVVPPVPIPNTEVKCLEADGSRKARVGSPHLCIQSLSLWPVGLARGDAYLYNMGMRGLVSKRKFAIGTVVVLFLLSLNLISSQVREFVTSVSSPLQVSLWQAGKNISTFFGGGSLPLDTGLTGDQGSATNSGSSTGQNGADLGALTKKSNIFIY